MNHFQSSKCNGSAKNRKKVDDNRDKKEVVSYFVKIDF
jgi:hypothetical protein